MVEGGSGHKGFFIFVAVFALIGTLIIFILAVLNIRSMVLRDRWPLIVTNENRVKEKQFENDSI